MARPSLQNHIRSFEKAYASGWRSDPTGHHRTIFRLSPFFRDHGVERILDIGCGRGLVLKQLAMDGFDVLGTEVVPCLLAKDLKWMSAAPTPVHDMDIFVDNTFDLVLMTDFLDHLRDEQEVDDALSQASRLASNGIIVTLGGPSSLRTIDQPRDWWREKICAFIKFPVRTNMTYESIDGYAFWEGDE